MNNIINQKNKNNFAKFILAVIILGFCPSIWAITIGSVASNVTASFTALTQLITAASYISGLAFAIGAILKFKQHKDNPTQIPIGTPIALLFVAAALLFLPSILTVAGDTMFGSGTGETAGPTGTVF